MDEQNFQAMAENILDELPLRFQAMLENVVIVIEDFAAEQVLDAMAIRSEERGVGKGFRYAVWPEQ